ncbi:glutaminase A [Paraburkholderia unamae]|uniref:Glutaminase A n=1 Tax=Paraburkholderia unamae TaxID=219649 RepID=A0ACC6RSI2_9BURK
MFKSNLDIASPGRRRVLACATGLSVLALFGHQSASATVRPADMPSRSALGAVVKDAHEKFAGLTSGKNADYIPYLATVPSNLFGIAVVTATGETITAGDVDYAFAIESISKLFTLGLVMDDIGADALRKKIGASPTGMPFNSVQAIELHGGKPLNPFVNAGAIATTSLVPGSSPDAKWANIIGEMSAFAGHELEVNEQVYQSESDTNQHNRGIAMLLQSYGYMYSDPMAATDLYTRQCSVAVSAKDLATMGAVLAAKGVHPGSGKRLLKETNVREMLAEMTLNGMYDASGDWVYQVGLPAKSGVGGGVLAVVPGKMAIAAFSPPLDTYGNSVRAQAAIAHISSQLKLGVFGA